MKKLILLILLFTFSFSSAQKKELRNANKFFVSGEYASAIDLLDSTKDLFDSSDDKIKAQVMLLYGKLHTTMEDFELAIKAFDMSKNLGSSDKILNPELRKLETAIITSAVSDNETEDYIAAAKKLKMVYDLNTETNSEYLYYAASSAVNSLDYTLALEYYERLRDIKYEGIETKFYITEVSSGNEIEINDEVQFKLLQKSKDYSDAREEVTDSKFPEIVKNIALIYKELGQNDKALIEFQKAEENLAQALDRFERIESQNQVTVNSPNAPYQTNTISQRNI